MLLSYQGLESLFHIQMWKTFVRAEVVDIDEINVLCLFLDDDVHTYEVEPKIMGAYVLSYHIAHTGAQPVLIRIELCVVRSIKLHLGEEEERAIWVLVDKFLRTRSGYRVIVMLGTHAIQLVELLMMLDPLLKDDVLTLEPLKGECQRESFLSGHHEERMRILCARGFQDLDHKGVLQVVLLQVILDLL